MAGESWMVTHEANDGSSAALEGVKPDATLMNDLLSHLHGTDLVGELRAARKEIVPTPKGPDFQAEGATVARNFARTGNADQIKYAGEWQKDIEQRVAKGDLSRDEAARTYEQVNKLLTNKSNSLSDKQRVNVAAEILMHTGHGRVDQGLHGTCNVTVLENIAFSQHPSVAARMIASTALTGSFVGSDGGKVTVPAGSLAPGWEEDKFPPEDLLRSHASQIFQVAALNDVGRSDNKDPKEFVQKKEGIGTVFRTIGEAILPWSEYWMSNGTNVWKHADGSETNFEGLSAREIKEESRRLFGDKYEVIAYQSPYEKWSHPFSGDAHDYDQTDKVNSEANLRQELAKLNSAGRLPVVVAVNGDNKHIARDSDVADNIFSLVRDVVRPIKSLHEEIDMKLGVANHVVTVTKYDPSVDRVYVSNSWGEHNDGWISVDDLWSAL
jgi:hypothetical protein